MLRLQIVILPILGSMAAATGSLAQETRYFEKNGVTYVETRQTTAAGVPQVDVRPVYQGVPAPAETTARTPQVADGIRWVPVSQRCWEPVLIGAWNPFVEPYWAYRPVCRTRWEIRKTDATAAAAQPTRALPTAAPTPAGPNPAVPVPTPAQPATGGPSVPPRLPAPSSTPLFPSVLPPPPPSVQPPPAPTNTPAPAVAQREVYGGVRRLDDDPPRHGLKPAWQPAPEAFRR